MYKMAVSPDKEYYKSITACTVLLPRTLQGEESSIQIYLLSRAFCERDTSAVRPFHNAPPTLVHSVQNTFWGDIYPYKNKRHFISRERLKNKHNV